MKRFYKEAAAVPAAGGWQVALDGRAVKTANGKAQIVQSRALAEALASEWDEQGEEIDPSAFLFRDLADYAIDIVGPSRDAAVQTLLAYAETDTLCYRADPDEPLFKRQQEVWEPLLARIEAQYAIRLERVSGIIHRPQPPASLEGLREMLAMHSGPAGNARLPLRLAIRRPGRAGTGCGCRNAVERCQSGGGLASGAMGSG
jgi:chaperone required for assembly of F1-ATPase